MRPPTATVSSPLRRGLLGVGAATLAAPPGAFARSTPVRENPFGLGIASGYPRPTSVVLWTRLTAGTGQSPVPVRWELAKNETFSQRVAHGVEFAITDDAFCVHAEPSGLAPGRVYFYRFEALGVRSSVGRTRTAPDPSQGGSLRLAIASCQRFDTGHYAAWRRVADRSLDLVVFLGDYIYEYATRSGAVRPVGERVQTLDDFRDRYAMHRSDPALQAAHAAHPWLIIWDDHEVDNDYAALTGQSLQPDFARYRSDAYRAWWEHMPVPKAWRPNAGTLRIHDRFDWGRLARIHLLDTRQYRDLQACPRPGRAGSNSVTLAECSQLLDPSRSLLGAEQERWLESGFDLERRWNLIAQTTLMARSAFGPPGAERHWTDGWDGYPAARTRLLNAIATRRVPGPLVLSGDVHSHVVANLKANFEDSNSPVIASEFCCTSISSLGPPKGPRRREPRGQSTHSACPIRSAGLHRTGDRRGSRTRGPDHCRRPHR